MSNTSFFRIKLIEAPCHLASQLDVRDLVFSDRNEIGLVHEYVGGLQQRVAQESVGSEILVLYVFALLFITRNAFQPSQRCNHTEEQMQFSMLRHMRLNKQRAALGIEARRKVVDHDFERTLLNIAGVGVIRGERVPISEEKEAIVFVLQLDPIAQGPDIIAEMQFASRAHAAQDAPFCASGGIGHQSLTSAFNRE